MQDEREMPDMEAISEVFRELGLEDPDVQERFRQLAEPSDWYTWRKRRYEPQDTRKGGKGQPCPTGTSSLTKSVLHADFLGDPCVQNH